MYNNNNNTVYIKLAKCADSRDNSVTIVWYHDCAWLIPRPMLSEKHSLRQEVALSMLVQVFVPSIMHKSKYWLQAGNRKTFLAVYLNQALDEMQLRTRRRRSCLL